MDKYTVKVVTLGHKEHVAVVDHWGDIRRLFEDKKEAYMACAAMNYEAANKPVVRSVFYYRSRKNARWIEAEVYRVENNKLKFSTVVRYQAGGKSLRQVVAESMWLQSHEVEVLEINTEL